jgi:hypothetical protein
MRRIMGPLKLTAKEEKTRICRVPEDSFDVGYTLWTVLRGHDGAGLFGQACIEEEYQAPDRIDPGADRPKSGSSLLRPAEGKCERKEFFALPAIICPDSKMAGRSAAC